MYNLDVLFCYNYKLGVITQYLKCCLFLLLHAFGNWLTWTCYASISQKSSIITTTFDLLPMGSNSPLRTIIILSHAYYTQIYAITNRYWLL